MSFDPDRLSPAARALWDSLVSSGHVDASRARSGYRSPARNAAVGGARNSQHTRGNAIDVSTRGWTDEQRSAFLASAIAGGARGIGIYPGGAIHIDVRQNPAVWGTAGRGGFRAARNADGTVDVDAFPDWAEPHIEGLLSGNLPAAVPPPAPTPVPRPVDAVATPDDIYAAFERSRTPGPVAPLPATPVPFTAYAGMEPPDAMAAFQNLVQPAAITPTSALSHNAGAMPKADFPAPPVPAPPPPDFGARVDQGWDVFAPPPPQPAPPFDQPPRQVGPMPDYSGYGGQDSPREAMGMAEQPTASAMDVFNGLADRGVATNGDIISRGPDGSLTRQSARYGYVERIDQGGNFRGFASTPEGSPSRAFQSAVHNIVPGMAGAMVGAGAGGALLGPMGVMGGAALGRAGSAMLAAGETPDYGSMAGTIGGGALGALAGGPVGAVLGAMAGNRVSGLLSPDRDEDEGFQFGRGPIGGLLSAAINAAIGRRSEGGGSSWFNPDLTGDGSEGGYESRLRYSDNGTPLPPSRPPGGGGGWWGGWGGGGGGGVRRDGSDR